MVAQGVMAGLVGTTAMTFTTSLEQRLRPHLGGPVDYDASDAPVTAAARVLHLRPRTDLERRILFAVVHWGYGSFVGVGLQMISRRIRSPQTATIVFYAAAQTMAFALLPALGGTPVPWRWRRDMLTTSLIQHAVYAAATGAATNRLSQGDRQR